jgi:hypothetical protein
MRAHKIKLDDYDIRVVINGLAQYRKAAPDEDLDVIEPMLLRLIRELKDLKPGKRTKLPFSPEEKRLIRFYLNEWRNQLIRENNLGGMDGVSDVMLKFT